ncbi:MAG: PLP-dependent aminotransferase family protein [Candidatus Limnocylindria bacterium]|nr:PLP-dependent aminotransferase family protein [Candidatus Limnocylindria bacterium]
MGRIGSAAPHHDAIVGGSVDSGLAEGVSLIVLGMTLPEVHHALIDDLLAVVVAQTRDTVSFAMGSPAPEALALVGVAELVAAVAARRGPGVFGYGVTEGEAALREVVAADARAHGLTATTVDNVMITGGALQAIGMLCRVLAHAGDAVVTEAPSFGNSLNTVRHAGLRLLEAPVDDEGLDVDAAAALIRSSGVRPRIVLVNPTFQNPTGSTLSLVRRRALVALAEEHGAVIIDDDPYRELRSRGTDLPALATLASPQRVVSVGSFSKTIVPGFRVGWAIGEPSLVRRLAAVKQSIDGCSSPIGQQVIAEFHARGRMPAHLAQLRSLYAAKRERARAALAREFAGTDVHWNDPDGGFYLWVRLPAGMDAHRLLALGLEEGVAFVPSSAFSVGRELPSAIRLSYAHPTLPRIDEGVTRLRRAFDRLTT